MRKEKQSGLKRKTAFSIFMAILLMVNIFELTINTSTAAPVTRRVPQDYATIQAAINAANAGDTILVDVGTYVEYVCINKSITLKGINRQSIIKGVTTPCIIEVKPGKVTFTGKVKISGFTILDPTSTQNYQGIYVEPPLSIYLSNINITDNTIIGCHTAIFYARSSKCFITNNTLNRNAYGIRLYDTTYSTVAENFINASYYYGINFYARSRYNYVTKNTITKGKYGVLFEYSNYTAMYLNTIESNTDYGIRLSYSFNSLIQRNTVKNNKYGIYIWNCSQNQFYYNNFITNTIQQEHYAVPATNKSNTWDTNTPPPARAKGNYWSDYAGLDNGVGVGRWGEPRYASDGVGDTLIPHQGLDTYPLMFPWTPIPPGPLPVAIFTWSPPEPICNLIATFNASKSYDINGTIISYKWNFGDGNITTVTNPIITHIFKNTGSFTVTLTVTDNDNLTNSTSHVVKVLLYGLELDVYTQQPEPYSGRGPHMPSDAFAPQSLVILYAEVTYNYEPIENKEVSFEVKDPNGELAFVGSNFTDADGIAYKSFRLATNATFGLYNVFAQVDVSGRKANDTLTFLVGWIIEVISVKTTDQDGVLKGIFAKGEQIYFSIRIKNIAFTIRNATLTVGLKDPVNQTIGTANIELGIPPGTYEYNLIFNVIVPQWTFIGSAEAHACAFTKWPWIGGVPYCPEIKTPFSITS